MAFKTFHIDTLGEVTIYKRRGTRSLRLTIRPDNSLRVTIPTWMAYAAGLQFARTRTDWVQKHARPAATTITNNQAIGKAHHLVLMASTTALKGTSRIVGTEIKITYPADWSSLDPRIQTVANRAALRALRSQAEKLLPGRLADLAARYDFTYNQLSIKQLRTRWGSCDQDQNITLNLFLMQLPWELIDYVLLHELTHTKIMQHGPRFWQAMEQLEPKTSTLRKSLKAYRTIVT